MQEKETPANYYVDKKELYRAIVEYKNNCKVAEDEGLPKPKIPEYIGDCILKIATNLSYRYNFIRYPYRDEMIADGVENCILYFDNFDTDKYSNPFGYFTTILYYAYTRRIMKEKKQLYVRHKLTMKHIDEGLYDQMLHEEEGVDLQVNLDTEYMNDFVKNFEESLVKKRDKRSKKRGVEEFYEESDEQDIEQDDGIEILDLEERPEED